MLGAGLGAAGAGSAAAAPSYRLLLTFDTGDTLTPDSNVQDTSGYGHRGIVRVSNGGALERVSGYAGTWSARFPAACKGGSCPKAVIEVPDAPQLDPGLADFEFGLQMRVAAKDTSKGSNLVQKGLWSGSGSQWKLQVDGKSGQPSCIISGERNGRFERAKVVSSVSVADGAWHRVVCQRSDSRVRLLVDGVQRGSEAMRAVNLSSTAPIRIGAKHDRSGNNDQYHGQLDDVFVRML